MRRKRRSYLCDAAHTRAPDPTLQQSHKCASAACRSFGARGLCACAQMCAVYYTRLIIARIILRKLRDLVDAQKSLLALVTREARIVLRVIERVEPAAPRKAPADCNMPPRLAAFTKALRKHDARVRSAATR